ncbi:MAG: peptidoglycan DD-metalloendopeptidase family protein [Bacteroidetes bacterium]|nr:peptidoglycan DD-metalloendopeptidase family protein [Bacteroidota bacterium]
MKLIYKISFCFIIALQIVYTNQDVQKKKKDLVKLKNEIEEFEKKIDESERKEKNTLEQLDNYEKQTKLLHELIDGLNNKQAFIRQSILKTIENIVQLEKEINILKEHYSKYVKNVYTKGRTYDFETLISSTSINQLYIRLTYLKSFSDQRRKDLQDIRSHKDILLTQQDILFTQLREEEKLITDKKNEESKTIAKTEKRKTLLQKIRKDKSLFVSELNRKLESAKKLEGLISQIIESEIIRKEEERKREKLKLEKEKLLAKKSTTPKPNLITFKDFPNKGNLRWPVNSRIISAGFGSIIHPVLKTVTQNNGIDIKVPAGTLVKCVAVGEVSMVHWLPSFGNLVIVTHAKDMRTVYTNLKTVSVQDGDKINEGDLIGTSGESVEGELLHFEIWKEKVKQNPKEWLAKK